MSIQPHMFTTHKMSTFQTLYGYEYGVSRMWYSSTRYFQFIFSFRCGSSSSMVMISNTLLLHGFGLLAIGSFLYFVSGSVYSSRAIAALFSEDESLLGTALRGHGVLCMFVACMNLRHAFETHSHVSLPAPVLICNCLTALHFMVEAVVNELTPWGVVVAGGVLAWNVGLLFFSVTSVDVVSDDNQSVQPHQRRRQPYQRQQELRHHEHEQ